MRQHELCSQDDYQPLHQQFQAMIVAHASELPEEASAEATSGAQQWLATIEAAEAEGSPQRKLKAQMVLLAYYGLFDMHRQSAALADVCPM